MDHGSTAPAVEHRARQLGVTHVMLGAARQGRGVGRRCAARSASAPEACAHIGDDLPDVPLLARVRARGHRAARARSRARARALRDARDGGDGAVREVAELILAAQDRLAAAESAHDVAAGLP